jgi:hypothetical protein
MDNKDIAFHFFCPEKSSIELIDKLENHTRLIFEEIKTELSYNNKKYIIDRSIIYDKILKSKNNIIILS